MFTAQSRTKSYLLLLAVASFLSCKDKSADFDQAAVDRKLYSEISALYFAAEYSQSGPPDVPVGTPAEFVDDKRWELYFRELAKGMKVSIDAYSEASDEARNRARQIFDLISRLADDWAPTVERHSKVMSGQQKRLRSQRGIELEDTILSLPGAKEIQVEIKKRYGAG